MWLCVRHFKKRPSSLSGQRGVNHALASWRRHQPRGLVSRRRALLLKLLARHFSDLEARINLVLIWRRADCNARLGNVLRA